MTELAALNIRITGDSKDLTAAVNAADTELKGLNATASKTQARMGATGTALGGLSQRMGSARGQVQNVAFQLQDMAVQLQAGTSASVVFAQQGSQIASAFGPVGAVIGAIAAVGLPLLAFAFSSAGTEAVKFKDTLDGLKSVTDELKAAQDILAMTLPELYEQYGLYAGAVRDAAAALVELQAAEAQSALNKAITDGAAALGEYSGAAATAFSSGTTMAQGLVNIRDQFGLVGGEAQRLQGAFSQLQSAVGFDEQVRAVQGLLAIMRELNIPVSALPPELRQALIQTQQLTIAGAELKKEIQDGQTAMERLRAAVPGGGWLSGAISSASTLASTLWDAAAAKAAATGEATAAPDERGTQRGQLRSAGEFKSRQANRQNLADMNKPGAGGGGGGGAATNPIQGELEALQQSLMTQEQLEMESFARRQEMLAAALEQQYITKQQYDSIMEQSQAQHQAKMAEIDAYRYGSASQQFGQFMGDMASALQGGNDKMMKAARIFGAAEALINAWRAYSQTIADPTLPFFAKFAAGAKVLAAGMAAVNAIKGGSKSAGGGARSAGASSAAPQQNVQTLNFTVQNDPFGFGQNLIRQIAGQLNEAQRNGSTLIRANVS